MSPEFMEACIAEIERLERRATKIAVLMLEADGEAREWALANPGGPNLRNRLARGELVEVDKP